MNGDIFYSDATRSYYILEDGESRLLATDEQLYSQQFLEKLTERNITLEDLEASKCGTPILPYTKLVKINHFDISKADPEHPVKPENVTIHEDDPITWLLNYWFPRCTFCDNRYIRNRFIIVDKIYRGRNTCCKSCASKFDIINEETFNTVYDVYMRVKRNIKEGRY